MVLSAFLTNKFRLNRPSAIVSTIDSQGRTIWIADAHRGDGKRFVVHADEKLSAFLELERAIRSFGVRSNNVCHGLRCEPEPTSEHS
jgi:hypothetical protein